MRRKTRQERRRERIQTAITALAMVVIGAVLMVWAVGIWAEHPAEQPISGTEYLESIRNGGYSDGYSR